MWRKERSSMEISIVTVLAYETPELSIRTAAAAGSTPWILIMRYPPTRVLANQLCEFMASTANHKPFDVRFGSLADTMPLCLDVRFTPESCRDIRSPSRQLRANSGLMHRRKTASLFALRPIAKDVTDLGVE